MSETASVRSTAGSEMYGSQVQRAERRVDHSAIHSSLSFTADDALLTKENLIKNDSKLANSLREYRVYDKVDRIAVAAKHKPIHTELPEKTKRQLLENMSGASPMKRFLNGAEQTGGRPVDQESWHELVQHDSLAAELEALCQKPLLAVAS